jgi:hypothetical protein
VIRVRHPDHPQRPLQVRLLPDPLRVVGRRPRQQCQDRIRLIQQWEAPIDRVVQDLVNNRVRRLNGRLS